MNPVPPLDTFHEDTRLFGGVYDWDFVKSMIARGDGIFLTGAHDDKYVQALVSHNGEGEGFIWAMRGSGLNYAIDKIVWWLDRIGAEKCGFVTLRFSLAKYIHRYYNAHVSASMIFKRENMLYHHPHFRAVTIKRGRHGWRR